MAYLRDDLSLLGRSSLKEVILKDKLKNVLVKLNKHLPESCIDYAISEVMKSRATLTPVMANKEVYEHIKSGVQVSYKNKQGREENDYVRIIDFSPKNENEFLIVSQLSIEYQQTQNITRRPDLLFYVNGLPLVMIEFKNVLVALWYKEKATQEKVKREIQVVLGHYLPEPSYDRLTFSQKVDITFQHFYELAQMGLA